MIEQRMIPCPRCRGTGKIPMSITQSAVLIQIELDGGWIGIQEIRMRTGLKTIDIQNTLNILLRWKQVIRKRPLTKGKFTYKKVADIGVKGAGGK